MLGPQVKDPRPVCSGRVIDRDQAKGRKRSLSFVVWVITGWRRVIVSSTGQFTARKQARRLPQFFSLPLAPEASM